MPHKNHLKILKKFGFQDRPMNNLKNGYLTKMVIYNNFPKTLKKSNNNFKKILKMFSFINPQKNVKFLN